MTALGRSYNVRPCFERGGFGIIPLTRGFEAIVNLEDLALLSGHNWSAHTTLSGHAYATRAAVVDGKRTCVMMHRLLTGAAQGMVVDHVNGNGLDNRRANLRVCTHSDNMKNQVVHRTNRLQAKGVHLRNGSGQYRARITFNGKKINLGSYPTVAEAAAAYRGAAKALCGEFANEP